MTVRKIDSRPASLADVARVAGVSKKSVSRVVNGADHVSDDLRRKVEKVIDDLNYRPDPKARSLRSGKSYTIVFLYEKPASYFVIGLVEGIRETCQENGYELVIHECPPQGVRIVRTALSVIDHLRPDGIIMMPPLTDDVRLLAALQGVSVPYARIAPGNGCEHVCDVATTDRKAGAEMADYLVSLGHRVIGYISGDPEHVAMAARLEGFKDRLRQAPEGAVRLQVAQGFNTFSSGRRAGADLLHRNPRPTALFAANDDMAAGAMFEAHELGLSIPDQLSIAGFDDTPLADRIWPGLTSVRQPIEKMGAAATDNLLKVVNGSDVEMLPPVPTTIIFRRSTGPAPKALTG